MSINRQEAIIQLDDEGEHKFLMRGESPVYIMKRSRESDVHALLHEHLAQQMIEAGIFPDLGGVMGGYCRVLENQLRYWGESSYPIQAATEGQFQTAIDRNGIELV